MGGGGGGGSKSAVTPVKKNTKVKETKNLARDRIRDEVVVFFYFFCFIFTDNDASISSAICGLCRIAIVFSSTNNRMNE